MNRRGFFSRFSAGADAIRDDIVRMNRRAAKRAGLILTDLEEPSGY